MTNTHAPSIQDVLDVLQHMSGHTDQQFAKIDERFARIDDRFALIDERFEQIDKRFEQIDKRFEQIDKRFDQVDQRLDRLEKRVASVELKQDDMQIDIRITNRKMDLLVDILEKRRVINAKDATSLLSVGKTEG